MSHVHQDPGVLHAWTRILQEAMNAQRPSFLGPVALSGLQLTEHVPQLSCVQIHHDFTRDTKYFRGHVQWKGSLRATLQSDLLVHYPVDLSASLPFLLHVTLSNACGYVRHPRPCAPCPDAARAA